MRLRYASVLFQETENFMEAEETLSKGVCKSIRCARRFCMLTYIDLTV